MRVIATTIVILLTGVGAFAQSGGHVGLYSDYPGFSDCNLVETVGVVNAIYVVHVLLPEASASRFRVVHNWHQAAVLSTEYHSNLTSGSIYTGTTVTYPGCETIPYLIATLQLLPSSPVPPCAVYFYVLPDPAAGSGHIETFDCASAMLPATGGAMSVKGNEVDCPCFFVWEYPPWVATEATTWGAVKALYR
jgi:hypothetical protein